MTLSLVAHVLQMRNKTEEMTELVWSNLEQAQSQHGSGDLRDRPPWQMETQADLSCQPFEGRMRGHRN